MALINCPKCGKEIYETASGCPNCGYSIDVTSPRYDAQEDNRKRLIIGIILAGVVIAIIALVVLNKKDFNDLYPGLDSEVWCTIASNGTYMKIDTNPYNKDEDEIWNDYDTVMSPATDMIRQINEELGFSEALYQEMISTSWADGKQSEANEKYIVTWTYHPDKGLEVIYEIMD